MSSRTILPHFGQKTEFAGIGWWQCGQPIVGTSGVPQLLQKLALSGFALPHLGQIMFDIVVYYSLVCS
jgi:hypothetical protein